MHGLPPLILYRHLIMVAAIALSALTVTPTLSHAKTPGKTYCFRGFCHTVLTLAQTQQLVGTSALQITSNYDDCKRDRFNPCGLTSSGAVFEPEKADNAASPLFPDGTIILVRHPKTNRSAVLRVNSAGPYHHDRVLDVSRATAEVLGFKREGVATLEVKVLKAPEPKEATYVHKRVYPEVPGFLGEYASLDQATAGLTGTDMPTVQVPGIYPQVTSPARAPTTSVASNGLETRWLGQALTTRLAKADIRRTRRYAAMRLVRLDAKRRRHARVG